MNSDEIPWWSNLSPESLPHAVTQWEIIDTHISRILLTGQWAYKFKKPVCFPFLDYSTIQKRCQSCHRELSINRRFSDNLYDSVWMVVGNPLGDQLESTFGADANATSNRNGIVLNLIPIDALHDPLDFAVRMRQFSQESLLSKQLSHGCLSRSNAISSMDQLASLLAKIHAQAPLSKFTPDEFAEITGRWCMENFHSIRQFGFQSQLVDELEWWCVNRIQSDLGLLESRAEQGFVRECHGDLHLDNVIFHEGQFQLFDGIEFNRELSEIDVASDLAFLVMELTEHGYAAHASRLLSGWLEATDDYAALQELPFYLVYRALVRAKVDLIRQAELHASDPCALSRKGEAYLKFACQEISGKSPVLYLMHGLSGSGKSTTAMQIVQHKGAVRLRSDWIRKQLLGMHNPNSKTDSAMLEHAYSRQVTGHTYEHLLQRCQMVLRSGYSAIADATFLHRFQREPFLQLADSLGVAVQIVHCQAPLHVLQSRLELRGEDPSDATLETIHHQMATSESWTDRERRLLVAADDLLP